MGRSGAILATVVVAAVLAGCATGPDANPRDPLEPLNRTVFGFNDALDKAVLKPVAQGYQQATPALVRTGVSNFFRNLSEPWSFVNNVAQGRISDAGETFIRFTTNTVFGLGGVLDIAGEARIPQHKQGLGDTLARYQVPAGPYVVVPLFGPSTVRDTAALPVDLKADTLNAIDDVPWRNSLYALRLVSRRAELLGPGEVLEQAALDKYSFVRDAYLQRLQNRQQRADRADAGEVPAEMADTAPASPDNGN